MYTLAIFSIAISIDNENSDTVKLGLFFICCMNFKEIKSFDCALLFPIFDTEYNEYVELL